MYLKHKKLFSYQKRVKLAGINLINYVQNILWKNREPLIKEIKILNHGRLHFLFAE